MAFLSDFTGVPYIAAGLGQAGSVSQEYDSGELTLPGTITWSGGAPSGAITQKYRWVASGKNITVYWCITASVAGLLTTGAQIALPATCPVPFALSNQAANSWISTGTGAILATLTGDPSSSTSGLFKDSGGVFWLKSMSGVTSAILVTGNITYLSI